MDSNGVLYPKHIGVAVITAKAKDSTSKQDTCLVTVNQNGINLSKWTVMVYSVADNDLEPYLLDDVEEMKQGYQEGINLILLIDRSPYYSENSSILGENFSDTRLFEIKSNSAKRLAGGAEFPEITINSTYEANMGDVNTLKKFIEFCKNNYPATNYALFIENHGAGIRGKGLDLSIIDSVEEKQKMIGIDYSSDNDALYIGEITDGLEAKDSIDILGFDACVMGNIEVLYQFNPQNNDFNTKYIVASPSDEIGSGWNYKNIFERIKYSTKTSYEADDLYGGNELYYNPVTLSPVDFTKIIIEEYYDTAGKSYQDQSFGVYDMSQIIAVKQNFDKLASLLKNEQTNVELARAYSIKYFNSNVFFNWVYSPLFDLYSLAENIYNSTSFSKEIRDQALVVMNSVDSFVVKSFAGSIYNNFTPDKNGVSVFFTDGNRMYNYKPMWAYQWWYTSLDTQQVIGANNYYGKLFWCKDNATQDNKIIENWFELLDYYYDDPTQNNGGGYNFYGY
ncbi:MAG: hypothetical protein A2086_01795 [Spirochaetes bacterium GWD1_27_9]|nr:MAG: hypothetical protein A2Z98_09795 [Spirochaetes bacterium GWB1_27_13]OHD25673.1 MAG: hypothetical protein A2Y34_02250 [Spirochaetes bacterium GWC1_27_15]OHD41625.1 MAG: hypothetical protein A2086_01795 [Spirochaetes bacterium GWD1_27_9]